MLETIWFALWGILWAVYFMLDGFDLGIGILNPFLAKTEADRGMTYQAMGPFWDGNEVWLITAGGVTFAAFPTTYAVMFSALYTPLLLILFGLIFRAVSIEYRTKVDNPGWIWLWDVGSFLGSLLPALLFGVAFANIFMGVPIDKEGVLQGNLLDLLNPYGLLGGVLFVLLFAEHGALWLAAKTEGLLEERAGRFAGALWWPLVVIAVAFLGATAVYTKLYENYLAMPPLFILPALAVVALLLVKPFIISASWWKAWTASAVVIACATLFGVAGMYPNLLPSSLDPSFNLTIWNSASSPLTLKIMLGVALTFVPVVIAYQIWGYYLFRGKVGRGDSLSHEGY
jgi:cytochrome d ubiquinol oxidase subunit II